MSTHDPFRTLKALDLLRTIAEKISSGAEFTNTDVGRKSAEFYVKTRERAAQYGARMIVSPRELSFLEGINARLKTRKKK